jgi:hypothetical protein
MNIDETFARMKRERLERERAFAAAQAAKAEKADAVKARMRREAEQPHEEPAANGHDSDPRADVPPAEDAAEFRDSNGAGGDAPQPDTGAGVSLDDFYAYMLANGYIFAPTGEIWPATSVNARLQAPDEKVSASKWLAQNQPVEQMTWAPGRPKLIKDSLISAGGWIRRPGCTVFNLYRPPRIVPQAGDVAPWLNLSRKSFPIRPSISCCSLPIACSDQERRSITRSRSAAVPALARIRS